VIDKDATLEIEWVRLCDVRFDDQTIDPAQVRFYQDILLGTDGHVAPPILNRDYTVRDGRHRLIAHLAAGRRSARCIIVTQPKRVIVDPDCPVGTAYMLTDETRR
jgi:hypothetical protein